MRFLNPQILTILFSFVLLIDITFGLSANYERGYRKLYGIVLTLIVVPLDIWILYKLFTYNSKNHEKLHLKSQFFLLDESNQLRCTNKKMSL